MNLLGLDTSTPATAVCLLRADGEAFEEPPAAISASPGPAHASELLSAIARVLERSGADYGQIDSLAVGVGPGGFTGLRIGIATARAIASALSLSVHPVSSLAALAAGAGPGPVLAVVDARRGEVFAALHLEHSVLWPPFVATPQALVERLRETRTTPTAAGNGAVRFRDVLEAAGARVAPDDSPLHAMRALHVCRLAREGAAVAPEAVVPHYLRMPDAMPTSTLPVP